MVESVNKSQASSSKYQVGVHWDKQNGCEANIRDLPPITIDMAEKHGGRGISYCPHEIFFSALGSCFLGTFLVFQRQLQLQMQDLKVSVRGNVEQIKDGDDWGKYDIKDIEVSVYLKVVGDAFEKEVASDCLRMTEMHCPVARTLRKAGPITVVTQIETTDHSQV